MCTVSMRQKWVPFLVLWWFGYGAHYWLVVRWENWVDWWLMWSLVEKNVKHKWCTNDKFINSFYLNLTVYFLLDTFLKIVSTHPLCRQDKSNLETKILKYYKIYDFCAWILMNTLSLTNICNSCPFNLIWTETKFDIVLSVISEELVSRKHKFVSSIIIISVVVRIAWEHVSSVLCQNAIIVFVRGAAVFRMYRLSTGCVTLSQQNL